MLPRSLLTFLPPINESRWGSVYMQYVLRMFIHPPIAPDKDAARPRAHTA
jgi:hypothetical protein